MERVQFFLPFKAQRSAAFDVSAAVFDLSRSTSDVAVFCASSHVTYIHADDLLAMTVASLAGKGRAWKLWLVYESLEMFVRFRHYTTRAGFVANFREMCRCATWILVQSIGQTVVVPQRMPHLVLTFVDDGQFSLLIGESFVLKNRGEALNSACSWVRRYSRQRNSKQCVAYRQVCHFFGRRATDAAWARTSSIQSSTRKRKLEQGANGQFVKKAKK
jgi:hypothetical protein